MKILHVINSLNIGGAENLLINSLPSYLNDESVDEVRIYTLIKNNRKTSVPQDKLIEGNSQKIKSINSFWSLKKYLSNQDFDIIHAHLFPSLYFCAILKKFNVINCPLFLTEHNTFNRRRKHIIFKPIEKYIYKEFDKVICISKGTQNKLNEWLPKTTSKTKTIYNGINLEKFKNSKTKNINSKTNINICMVGSFTDQKDQKTLIKALKILPEKYNLYLAGDGPNLREMKKFSDKVEVNYRVRFLGYLEDIPELLAGMDLFVLSSHWEGFGLVIVEAMASGLPVIASDVPGVSEVVGEAGVLFPAGNENKLANQIMEITSETDIYENYRQKSLKRAKEFTIKKMVKKYIEEYKEFI